MSSYQSRGAPVAVQVHKGKRLVRPPPSRTVSPPRPVRLTHGGDLSIFEKLHRSGPAIYSVDEADIFFTSLFVFRMGGCRHSLRPRTGKKKNFHKREKKFKKSEKKPGTHRKTNANCFSVQRSFLTAFVRFSFSFAFVSLYFIIETQNVSVTYKIPV